MHFYPQRSVCYAAMELAAAEARYDDLYGGHFHDGTFTKWSKERSPATPYGHRDGVTFYVSATDDEPDATWLLSIHEAARRASASG